MTAGPATDAVAGSAHPAHRGGRTTRRGSGRGLVSHRGHRPVAFAGALALLAAVWLFARPLALVFAAVAIAQALSLPANWLARRLPRALAVALVYLALILALAGLGWPIVPRIVADAETLASRAPGLFARGREFLGRWDAGDEGQILQSVEGLFHELSGLLIELPMTVFSALTEIALAPFMSAYWLISAPRLLAWVRSLLPPGRADRMHAVLTESGEAIGGYVRGEGISAAIIGTVSYIGLSLIGVDFVLALAFLAALGEIIPVIGPIIAAGPAVAVGLLDSTETAPVVLAFYVGIQQFESNILIPQIMRHQAHVPPVLALAALFAGVAVGGNLGAPIAIPMAAALKVLVVRVAAPAIRRWTGAEAEAANAGAGA